MKQVALAAFIGAAIASQGAMAHGPNEHGSPSMSREIGFACLIPGHFEAGMTGKVIAE